MDGWIAEVVVDEKAAAIVEDERRRFEQEKGKVTEAMLGDLEGYIRSLLELMPYVPRNHCSTHRTARILSELTRVQNAGSNI